MNCIISIKGLLSQYFSGVPKETMEIPPLPDIIYSTNLVESADISKISKRLGIF